MSAPVEAIAVVLVLVVGPLLLGMAGLVSALSERVSSARPPSLPWNWKLTIVSALLYALAFNLIFFIQELFLVLPKALTPGLRPTLFHNNHSWEGSSPLASLFQGTGALAIFIAGAACAWLLRHSRTRSSAIRLFLIWMAYNGFFQSLPQIVIGAINPQNDVGMAMDYFRLSATAKTVAALVALAAIPPLALLLRGPLLGLAEDSASIATARGRTRYAWLIATLPAFVAIALIVPFRVPRNLIEVALLPLIVTVIGIAWIQAGAWNARATGQGSRPRVRSIVYPLTALLLLLLVFQLLLRPGIRFY